MEQRLEKVETLIHETKGDIKVIASSMSDMKDVVVEMGHTISKIFSITNRIAKTEKDIGELFCLTRDIDAEIHNKSIKHTSSCQTQVDDVEDKIGTKMDKYASLIFAILVISLGYIAYDIRTVSTTLLQVKDIVIVNKNNIKHNKESLEIAEKARDKRYAKER